MPQPAVNGGPAPLRGKPRRTGLHRSGPRKETHSPWLPENPSPYRLPWGGGYVEGTARASVARALGLEEPLAQSSSDGIFSPAFLVISAASVEMEMPSRRKRTEPSTISTCAPPGWKL